MDPRERDALDALARDYVSGALSPATMAGVARRLRTDEALRQAVARCERRRRSDASLVDDDRSRSGQSTRRTGAVRGVWNDARFWRRLCALALVAVLALTAALVLVALR